MVIRASERMSKKEGHFLAQQQEDIKKLQLEGFDVINLGRGNPDQATFPAIVDKFKEYTDNPLNHGYPPYGGKDNLKESIIQFYKDNYDVSLEKDEVTIFSGSAAALTALPMVLVNPGENVLTPDPAFFGYATGVRMAEGNNILMPLSAETNYLPDLTTFSKPTLENTKMMFLNYPHNPTGAGATTEFFDDVVTFAKANDIVVAHDFAYGDISFDKETPSFLQSSGSKDIGVEIYTLSKTFNMAGWRIAFAVGNKEVISLISDYIRSSVGGTFGAIQDAVAYGLTHSNQERKALRDLYGERKNAVIEALNQSDFEVLDSAGSFFLWLKLPDFYNDDIDFANHLLQEEKLALVAGSTFGSAGKGYIRISLVSNLEELLEGVSRLQRFSQKHRKDSYARS